MNFEEVRIPYGAYWSTPFSRWQASFAHLQHAFAAHTAAKVLKDKNIPLDQIDHAVLGMTESANSRRCEGFSADC